MTVLIGADPELFAFENNTPVSVHNLLKGTKSNPFPVVRGAVQVDGVAAEFNIEPTNKRSIFLSRISGVKAKMEKMISKANKNIKLVATPSVVFAKDYWDTVPLLNKELGCDPDFNAYSGKENPRPDSSKLKEPTLRTGSGHIHIGWRDPSVPFKDEDEKAVHFMDCRYLTIVLDEIILPFERQWDKDTKRRSLYGNPGAFRPKPYGMEYRVLSNAWVDKPEIAGALFDIVQETVKVLEQFGSKPIFYATNIGKDTFRYIYPVVYNQLRDFANKSFGGKNG